jgi:hypothetical protein
LVVCCGAEVDAEVGTMGTPIVPVEVAMTVLMLDAPLPEGCAKPEDAVA